MLLREPCLRVHVTCCSLGRSRCTAIKRLATGFALGGCM